VAALLLADELREPARGLVVERRREAADAVGVCGLERLDHLFLLRVGRARQLLDRGRAAQLGRQAVEQPPEPDVQLLDAARHVHRPRLVAEVPLDLSQDGRHGVRGQLHPPLGVEAVDRVDEADATDLDEVVERLAASRVAERQRADERHQVLDQLLARRPVALVLVRVQEPLALPLGCDVHGARWPSSPAPPARSSTHSPLSGRRTTRALRTSRSTTRLPPASSSGTNGPTASETVPPSRLASTWIRSPTGARWATSDSTESCSSFTSS